MQVWMNISTPIYFASLVSSTLIIGFNFYFFEEMQIQECFFDIFMLTDIVLVFFKASEVPSKNNRNHKSKNFSVATKDVFQRYEYHMGRIAVAYLKKTLITDLLSCIPTLLTLNKSKPFYYFKLFKFFQIIRIFEQMRTMKRVIVNKFMKDATVLEYFYQIIKSVILAFLLFHVFTCLWVREAISHADSWVYNQLDSSSN